MLTVFGSINLDICVRTARPPRPGETVLAADALVSPGGKGANQAHAAALFGVATRLFGQVGPDAFAAPALALLSAHGVDLAGVEVAPAHGTGLATITVDAAGENAIVVGSGANAMARADQVSDAVPAGTRVLLLQLEVPWAESLALARRAKAFGCRVILNAAPMPPAFRLERGVVDVLIVNGIELDQLSERESTADGDRSGKARRVAGELALDVLVTLGADGALMACRDGRMLRSAARKVAVVDTTGAGDTYAGVFGAALAMGGSVQAALDIAAVAAALACTRVGVQAAQPTRSEIERTMLDRPRSTAPAATTPRSDLLCTHQQGAP